MGAKAHFQDIIALLWGLSKKNSKVFMENQNAMHHRSEA